MDLVALLLFIAFEGLVGGVAVLLSLTYIFFARMEKDVRRARMFIMADRVKRFLGAFTLGFVVLAGAFAGSLVGGSTASGFVVAAFFFFLTTIAYGSVELFLIVRPRSNLGRASARTLVRAHHLMPIAVAPTADPSEDESDGTR